jgi:elongation factor P
MSVHKSLIVMAIPVNDLKPKVFFIYEDQPYVVLETHHLKMQQRRPVVQTRMRNLLNGKVLERNFAQSDTFEPADISRKNVKFLYNHRDQYWFTDEKDVSNRFQLTQEIIGEGVKFLKPNTVLEALLFNDDVINVTLPIKMTFKVVEAPPSIKGDTATGGMKSVKIDTGASVNTPLFINEGDSIIINTETGEYVERAK